MRGSSQPGRRPVAGPARASLRLRHDGVREVQARELDLLRVMDAELVEVPVVERPVVLVLERAERVRDALDRVGLAVRPVVHRVDAPGVARAMVRALRMRYMHGIAQVDVARRHVDLRPQDVLRRPSNSPPRIRRKRSRFSSTGAVAVRALAARLGQRAAVLAHLLGGQIVDVGLARLGSAARPTGRAARSSRYA